MFTLLCGFSMHITLLNFEHEALSQCGGDAECESIAQILCESRNHSFDPEALYPQD